MNITRLYEYFTISMQNSQRNVIRSFFVNIYKERCLFQSASKMKFINEIRIVIHIVFFSIKGNKLISSALYICRKYQGCGVRAFQAESYKNQSTSNTFYSFLQFIVIRLTRVFNYIEVIHQYMPVFSNFLKSFFIRLQVKLILLKSFKGPSR